MLDGSPNRLLHASGPRTILIRSPHLHLRHRLYSLPPSTIPPSMTPPSTTPHSMPPPSTPPPSTTPSNRWLYKVHRPSTSNQSFKFSSVMSYNTQILRHVISVAAFHISYH